MLPSADRAMIGAKGAGMMMRILLAFFVATAMATGALKAQNNPDSSVKTQSTPDASVAEPQYINSFYAVDANGKLIQLERKTVTFHSKAKVLPGYASFKMVTEFKLGQSSVRVSAVAHFIVRGRSPLDPASRYELRLLKASKDHREFMMTQGHGSVFGGGATSSVDEGALSIRFEEYGTNSYRITPEHPLPPGEYALAMRGMVSELYCFGLER
jgi:hypothetical protein